MATVALVGWLGLALQLALLILTMSAKGGGAADAIWRFFAYFTILTNILVASSLSVRLLAPGSPAGRFFARPLAEAGVLLPILTVFVIYVSVLQGLWEPQGAQLAADLILHYFVPLSFLGYWLAFVSHGGLEPRNISAWVAYPLAYGLYALARGAADGFYAYPFIDVAAIGYPRVLLNILFLVVAFAVAGLLLIGADRALGRLRRGAAARAAS
jgi:hypothetical protein